MRFSRSGSQQDGSAIKDWEQAKQDIENEKVKTESNKETKVAEPKAVASTESKTEDVTDLKSESKKDIVPKSKEAPEKDLEPPTVQRVHKLYEELGQEDVKEAQDWEKAEKEKYEHETHE